MNVWFVSLLSVSFIGLIFLALKDKVLQKLLLFLVSFATGSLLGGAFLHLLPEAGEKLGLGRDFSLMILGGILAFFILEKFIFWRNCHIPTSKNHPHPLVFMNLVGDGFHNLLDGVIIAACFMTNFSLGIATTMAVLIHEIPQEIGDFSVLLFGGFSRFKALLFNFLSALVAILGAILTLSLGTKFVDLVLLLIPFTAGGFIYIASSDLIPELKKETHIKKSLFQFLGLLLGILLMLLLTFNE